LSGSPRNKQEPIGGKVMQTRTPPSLSRKSAFCLIVIVDSGIPSASTRSPPFTEKLELSKSNPTRRPGTTWTKQKNLRNPGGFKNNNQARGLPGGTSWLSFGTAYRRVRSPSHFERGLNPARPGLSLGVSRRFGTMACLSRRRLA
jgi:hypothetical protein